MTLNQLRSRIDRIDLQLLRLLNRRAALALRIGALKKKQDLPVYDGRRENDLLHRLAKTNSGPLPHGSTVKIFREILRHSRQIQNSIK